MIKKVLSELICELRLNDQKPLEDIERDLSSKWEQQVQMLSGRNEVARFKKRQMLASRLGMNGRQVVSHVLERLAGITPRQSLGGLGSSWEFSLHAAGQRQWKISSGGTACSVLYFREYNRLLRGEEVGQTKNQGDKLGDESSSGERW